MKLTVLVPTYRRPEDLRRCLDALGRQVRSADEVLVVARPSDEETAAVLRTVDREALRLCVVPVHVPGQVAALNAGLEAAKGELIAITDDDAAPRPEWMARIEAHFLADPHVGAVGGRDQQKGLDEEVQAVGIVQWSGRTIGAHHLGGGPAREVDLLKGVNMSYRRTAIGSLRFDTRLRGQGAQVHNDMAFSLSLRRSGWRVIYDPAVIVDHYPTIRFDEDQRSTFSTKAHHEAVHNETLILLEHLPFLRRAVFLLWLMLVGTKVAPGLLLTVYLIAHRTPHAVGRVLATAKGRLLGIRAYLECVAGPVSLPPARRGSAQEAYPKRSL